VATIGAGRAYLDGELCGVPADGITSFSMIQAASDSGNAAALVFFLFDLLYLEGEDLCPRPLIERKARLAALLSDARSPLHYCDHQIGHGQTFHEKACAMGLEGIVSKRADAPYTPGNRGLLVKVKMPAPRGIRGGRLDRSRRRTAVIWQPCQEWLLTLLTTRFRVKSFRNIWLACRSATNFALTRRLKGA